MKKKINMDFVTGLPRTQRQHDAIWVIVDRLTKSAHFLPINVEDSLEKLAQLYVLGSIPMWPCLPQGERPPLLLRNFFNGHVFWQLLISAMFSGSY